MPRKKLQRIDAGSTAPEGEPVRVVCGRTRFVCHRPSREAPGSLIVRFWRFILETLGRTGLSGSRAA